MNHRQVLTVSNSPATESQLAESSETAADHAARMALARAAAGDLLGPADIQAIWRIGRTQFWRLDKARQFDHLKVKPAVGPRCFSGVLVNRYIQGEPLYEPTFGRKTFGKR